MAVPYARLHVYRGETEKDIEEDIVRVTISSALGKTKIWEVEASNLHKGYSDKMVQGDKIDFYLGFASANERILSGHIFEIEYPETNIILRGMDYSHFLVGAKVTRTYQNQDAGEIIKYIIEDFVKLKTDYLFLSSHIIEDELKYNYVDGLSAVDEVCNLISFDWRVDLGDVPTNLTEIEDIAKQIFIYPEGYTVKFLDGYETYGTGSFPTLWEKLTAATWITTSDGKLECTQSGTDHRIRIKKDYCELSTDRKCWVRFWIYTSANDGGVYLRKESSDDGYTFMLDATNDIIEIKEIASGTPTQLNSTSITLDTATWYYCEVEYDPSDGNMSLKIDTDSDGEWEATVSTTDTTYVPTTVGIWGNNSEKYDAFQVYEEKIGTLSSETNLIDYHPQTTQTQPITGVIVVGGNEELHDDFSLDLSKWRSDKIGSGTVQISNEELEISGNAFKLLTKTHEYLDMAAYVKIVSTTTGGAYLVFRNQSAADINNTYFISINSNTDQIRLGKNITGSSVYLGTIDKTIDTGTWYYCQVVANKENIYVYLEGDLIISAIDSQFTSGYIGLGSDSTTNSHFDDLIAIRDNIVSSQKRDTSIETQFGCSKVKIIKDPSLVTYQEVERRAELELSLLKVKRSYGEFDIEGTMEIRDGEMVNLYVPEAGIENVRYRVLETYHIIDDEEGFITKLKLAEDVPHLEMIIKALEEELGRSAVGGLTLTELFALITDTTITSPADGTISVTIKNTGTFVYDTMKYNMSDYA